MTAKCLKCGKGTTERFRPFCSKRCADLDLAGWFGGQYRIETDEEPELEDFLAEERENKDQ